MSPTVNFGTIVTSSSWQRFFSQIGWRVELGTAHDPATFECEAQVKIFLESSDATGRVVGTIVAAASSVSFSASVGACLSVIDVPYVAFGDLVDSSLSTLTVTSLGHVTEVLSPALSRKALFSKTSTSLLSRTRWTPVPVAIRLRNWKWMGKRHPPSTLCTRQLSRNSKLGCLSRPAMRPQQPASFTPSFSPVLVLTSYDNHDESGM